MTFASPDLLYFLFALPVLVGLRYWSAWRAGQIIESMTAPRLRSQLVVGVSSWRSGFIFALQLLALACFILAIAQPRWGEDKVIQIESGRNVIIAIDTSRSMLSNDIVPDRMTRAKLAAQDVLNTLKTDRVGLIAFAGRAYLQAPLTTDHEAVVEAIQSLDFTSVPRGGSELGNALKLAMETFEKNPARNHGLILFSDGGEPDAQVREYAQQAAKKNILILTVGVGTEEGALIPDPDPDRQGDYVRDRSGNVVKTKLEGSVLQEIAATTRGRYMKLGSQPLATSVVRELLSALQAQANEAQQLVKPIERFQWPLSMGVLLLMIAWSLRSSSPRRRLAPALALLCLGLTDSPVHAETVSPPSFWASVFSQAKVSPETAEEALKNGNHKLAAELFGKLIDKNPPESLRYRYAQALGYSAHQLKDYDRSVSAFSQALESSEPLLQEQAHQGLAHSLYDQGDRALAKMPKFTLKSWKDAVKHFDSALKIDPENTSIKENREFVKKRLDELQKQIDMEEKKGDKGEKGDKKKGQKGEKGEKGEDGEEGEEGEEGDENGEGQKKDRSRKESLGKQKGEQKEEEIPEGQLQAANKGEPKDEKGEEVKELKESESGDDQSQEATGFSRNEARSFLRAYADDQKKALLVRPRDPPVNGKDW